MRDMIIIGQKKVEYQRENVIYIHTNSLTNRPGVYTGITLFI